MHTAAYEAMQKAIETHLGGRRKDVLEVLEVGAHGSGYHPLIQPPWRWYGLDIKGGDEVGIVVKDTHSWPEVQGDFYDLVISGSCLEHTEYIWMVMWEIGRVLKPGGTAILIAPSQGPEHRYPIDCWRILPDGMRVLAKWAGLIAIDVTSSGDPMWADSVLVARK